MNIKQKITSAVVTAAMIGSVLAPVAHGATVTISGNGVGSKNGAIFVNKNISKTSQKSVTIASTGVDSSASTGGNNSSGNTGGANTVTSGPASSGVNVTVTGGGNTGSAPTCGCSAPDSSVTISGNGVGSMNGVIIANVNVTKTSQKSVTVAETMVSSSASTGGNNSSGNTGGANTVTSGPASSAVNVTVTGGSNTLN